MHLEKALQQIQRGKFWRDKKIKIFSLFCSAIVIFSFFYIYLQMRQSGQAVPLRYNILVGVESIGRWTKLLHLPFCGLIIFVINFFIIYKVYEKENNFLINLVLISTISIQIILLIAIFLITNL